MNQVCSCSVKVCFCVRGKGQVRAGEVEEARKRRKMPAYLALVWWYLWGFGNWGCCWVSRSASSSWPGEQGCHCVRKWKHKFKVVHITTPSQHSFCSLHRGKHKPSLPPCLPPSVQHYLHDSLLPLRMLQQLMEHLCLLHVSASARGRTKGILWYHGLRLQVHGVVPVRWKRWCWSHVTHVLWCHGPDHVRIWKTKMELRVHLLLFVQPFLPSCPRLQLYSTSLQPWLKVLSIVSTWRAGAVPIR